MKIIKLFFGFFVFALFLPVILNAQSGEVTTLTSESLKDKKAVEFQNLPWKYRAGDETAWAASDFNDGDWETIEKTIVKPEFLLRKEWKGRAWFRLRVNVAEDLTNKNVALITTQRGASEIYLDGRRLAKFGDITSAEVNDYNPNSLPIPFRFDQAGEHVIAVRFASSDFGDVSSITTRWLMRGGYSPGFSLSIRDASDLNETIRKYADDSSMGVGLLFVGILLALALLHFLLYLFYPVERANLFYSVYAAAFAILLLCGGLLGSGHQSHLASKILGLVSSTMIALSFVGLLAFLHVAFGRPLGKVFWILTALWSFSSILDYVFPNNPGAFMILKNLLISFSFAFSVVLLVKALREKRPGAWILMVGVQLLSAGMFSLFLNQFSSINLPSAFFFLGVLALILAVPVAVSIFLARNFSRTNHDLIVKLAQVEELSQQKIEQERAAAELHAENDRRAKELEEARQLQLSMLPAKLPQLPNLEIAAYMKPASEVGGDYYDFYVGDDGALTVAVGDATGHGLKAGTLVSVTKGVFNILAEEPDITKIFKQTSSALKRMKLRGLFMAMTMLKVKDNNLQISNAGMPSTLVYRADTKQVEEIIIKALPLGSMANFPYQERQLELSIGDCIVVMSDGFPEMFNAENQMLGFDKAAAMLPGIADCSSQEIINRFVETARQWAGVRPPDDDVTFVVLKVKSGSDANL